QRCEADSSCEQVPSAPASTLCTHERRTLATATTFHAVEKAEQHLVCPVGLLVVRQVAGTGDQCPLGLRLEHTKSVRVLYGVLPSLITPHQQHRMAYPSQ